MTTSPAVNFRIRVVGQEDAELQPVASLRQTLAEYNAEALHRTAPNDVVIETLRAHAVSLRKAATVHPAAQAEIDRQLDTYIVLSAAVRCDVVAHLTIRTPLIESSSVARRLAAETGNRLVALIDRYLELRIAEKRRAENLSASKEGAH